VTTIDVVDASGNTSGSVELPADLFDAQVNIPLIHQVVVGQLAAARQGTHDTKGRGEVSGGGRKPYRQKGTGRARQGSIRAPQFTGGGVVHGPTPHGHGHRTPKKMKAAALRGALSDRARDGRLHVVEGFVDDDTPSTRTAVAVLVRVSSRPNALVVVERGDTVTRLSLRNVKTVRVLAVDQLNTYDVLASDDVVFTRAAYDEFVATRSSTKSGGDDAPADDAAAAEAQPADAMTETPVSETPVSETPVSGTPAVEASADVAAPAAVDAPAAAETPAAEAEAPTVAETPAVETPAAETSADESDDAEEAAK